MLSVTENNLADVGILLVLLVLAYSLLLAMSVLSYRKRDPTILHCSVRRLPWLGGRCVLASAPVSPMSPQFITPAVPASIAAPRARHPVHNAVYDYRSGLSMDYEIEHYRPSTLAANTNRANPNPGVAVVPPLQSTLYPQYMQNVLVANPPPAAFRGSRSPPPLGDWPRPDIISQPSRSRSKRSAAHAHPSGPRVRSNSSGNARPPSLDLSNLSTFQATDGRNL